MEPLPHGYTNVTTGDGSVVTKRYLGPDAAGRCAREAAALRGLAGRPPVPPLLDCAERRGRMATAPGRDAGLD